MFPALTQLYQGWGEAVMEYFPGYGNNDDPTSHAFFIALFQPKSESAEAKGRRQTNPSSLSFGDNTEVF